MDPTTLHHSMFGMLVDVAVEGDGVGDTQALRVLDQPVLPPAAPDHVEMQIRHPGPEHRDGVEGVLDLLMRHQPGQHHQPRGGGSRATQRVGRGLIQAVADDGHPAGIDAEVGEVAHGRQRHGHVLVAPVQPG